MVGICRLDNPIRNYSWGSHSAIAELQRRSAPSREPEAELWIGAHPSAPSQIRRDGSSVPLPDVLRDQAADVLGPDVIAQHGERLPFLLKVLAAEGPLSIQAHPNPAQARAGFDRENASGIPLDAPHRNYRDPYAKPELICALTEFWALCGFRPAAEIAAGFRAFGVVEFGAEVDALVRTGDLAEFFTALMTAAPSRAKRAVSQVGSPETGPGDAAARWLPKLIDRYPDDIGALAPLYLNVVQLAPNEAIYLGAGQLHSYLHGTGIEIMASSDNVLRGGLTPKHVDVPELLRTLRFEAGAPEILHPVESAGGERVFETPSDAFELAELRLAYGDQWSSEANPGPAIWLVSWGTMQVRDVASGATTLLESGEAVLVPHCVERIEWSGEGTAFRASAGTFLP